jgi:MHS family proline/betaine transporter-like MFS transporter
MTTPSQLRQDPQVAVATDARPPQSTAKVIRAAILGTVVEYYDFGIYGYMATMISAHFFVSKDPTAALLGTFAAFAVAFFLRVPGGIFFGHIGDKYGRKKSLTWTILLMALATAAIGLVPTYATLGIWATALLVLARCMQGFSAGGELGGANAFVSESAPRQWRGFQTSMVNSGTYIGSLLAALVALGLNSAFSPEQVMDWAWRMPFVLSLVLGGVGLWIRSSLDDTPQFKELEESAEVEKLPIKTLLTTSLGSIVRIIFLGAVITGGYYIASVYAATYLQTAGGHSPKVAFVSTSIAMVVGVICLPLSGYLSDLYGRRVMFFAGSSAAAVLGIPMFMLMEGDSAVLATVAQSTLFACVSVVNGASVAAYAEMLSAKVRYSGIALSNNVTNMLLGGTAPFIATLLIARTGNNLAPSWYFVFCALLSLGAAFFVKETRGSELRL